MKRLVTSAILLILMFAGSAAHAVLLGPSPYLCFDTSAIAGCGSSESPFASVDFSGGYFHLEDFEDGLFNVAGASELNGGIVTSTAFSTIRDSVDEDDGVIDGTGSPTVGDSFFGNGATGFRFTFDAVALGMLPTHAGIVWTDGSGMISFEAFDQNGVSLGTATGNHANASFNGETDEDRFYGATNSGGISAIFISNQTGGIEADHLQYGNTASRVPVPEPTTLLLLGLGLAGLGFARKRLH